MRVGLIVRADQGGLGSQTRAIWENLQPDHTLVVRVDDPRGNEHPEDFDSDSQLTMISPRGNQIRPADAHLFVTHGAGVDCVVSVEGFYGHAFDGLPVRTVLIANPELFDPAAARVDKVVVPTPWELARMPPGTTVLPHPTTPPTDTAYVRRRDLIRTFLHVAAPAMLDRNGTDAVLDACRHMTEPCNLIVRAAGRPSPERGRPSFQAGKVDVTWDSKPVRHWWENYPVAADCLVLPRRYGGLCLVAQEAASCGVPLLMTDLPPQRWWPSWRARTAGGRNMQMKGGVFRVHRPDVYQLAAQMDALVRGELDVENMSRRASEWAASLSWDVLRAQWGGLCE